MGGRSDGRTDGHGNSTRLEATQLHVIVDENCVCCFFCREFSAQQLQRSGTGAGLDRRPLQSGLELRLRLGLERRLRLGLGLGLGLGLWLNLVVTRFKVSQLMRKFRCKNCFFFVFVFCFCCFLHACNKIRV